MIAHLINRVPFNVAILGPCMTACLAAAIGFASPAAAQDAAKPNILVI
jgi:hypothetical protein